MDNIEAPDSQFEILKKIVFENSIEKTDWHKACLEWGHLGTEDDKSLKGVCTCTQTNLRYIHFVQNANSKIILPIGSSCINRFKNEQLKHDCFHKTCICGESVTYQNEPKHLETQKHKKQYEKIIEQKKQAELLAKKQEEEDELKRQHKKKCPKCFKIIDDKFKFCYDCNIKNKEYWINKTRWYK